MHINICGYGFVGGSIGNLCKENDVKYSIYDVEEKVDLYADKCFKELKDLIEWSESKNKINYYFICVPTPTGDNGECDTSIVEKVVMGIRDSAEKDAIIIIKSTIPPGTTRRIYEKYVKNNIDIVFCPEFLREKSANEDMYNAEFTLIGTPRYDKVLADKLTYLFKNGLYKHKKRNFLQKILNRKNDFRVYFEGFEELELFKYTINTFLATKIIFFNEINELCDKIGVDYNNVKTLFKLEPRIGDYGTEVPGNGNRFYGYFLKCLPKEVKAMIYLRNSLDLSNEFMKCIDSRNEYFNNKSVK